MLIFRKTVQQRCRNNCDLLTNLEKINYHNCRFESEMKFKILKKKINAIIHTDIIIYSAYEFMRRVRMYESGLSSKKEKKETKT